MIEWRRLYPLFAFAALASAACGEQGSTRTDGRIDPAQPDPPAAVAANKRFANVQIVGAVAAPAPDGIATGRFVRKGDCLLFEADGGKAYNPVIAGEGSIEHALNGEPILSVRGRTIGLGQRIKVGGGGSGDVTNLSEAQTACSDSIFVIGEVFDERF
jgi:hypothetical protein